MFSPNGMRERYFPRECSEYYLFKCSHCNYEKYVKKRYFFTYELDWPTKMFTESVEPDFSYVQRCPHCGKYYIVDSFAFAVPGDRNVEDGNISVDELETLFADNAFMESLDDENLNNLILQYVYCYNKEYRSNNEPKQKASYGKSRLFTECILQIISMQWLPKYVIADLYRQIGMFRKCLDYIDENYSRIKSEDYDTVDDIKYFALKGETAPFINRAPSFPVFRMFR